MPDRFDRKITRFGYIINKRSLSDDQLNIIKTDLTVKPFIMKAFAGRKDNSFKLYVENGDYIGIPKYYGLEKFGKPEINRLEVYLYPKQLMTFTGKLRPRQEIIVKNILDGFNKHRGGLLIAQCGIGKTLLAIYIACALGLKTLFLVHKNFLKNQFIDRAITYTNVKKVGTIQGKKIDTDYPFVVGMIQSLVKNDYDDSLFKDFGLIIIDEVHHMGARNFSKIYQKMTAKYMLGITAEQKRNDGMYKILHMYMGPTLHMEPIKINNMVIVKRFHYKTDNKKRSKVIINKYTKEPDRSTMISNLVFIKRRNRFIINLINELHAEGKHVLVLSGRLKQINLFHKLLDAEEYTKGAVGKYIGGMPTKELDKSATKPIILGSYEMASEGLDIPSLNVVILCTPKSAIKQSVGRILRKDVYDEYPIVIDIIDDDNSVLRRQSNTRLAYYNKQQYNIQEFKVADYELDKYMKSDDILAIQEAIKLEPSKKKQKEKPKFSGPLNVEDIEFLDDD